ncbi:endonuclease V [Flavobacterium sp. J27]|uniref:endonuclease V n=1 Tax=Flavobacterium sp. J27 TaxID=2060419 RepID=UPI0010327662|nr:endonuclease V [Flavobacterium sp. J27]
MIVTIDVHYKADYAKTVLLFFENWQSETPTKVITHNTEDVLPYEPGSFYKRELPCILSALQETTLEAIKLIIIDGHIYVDNEGKYGLGGYLFEALDQKFPIIGVAKSSFQSNKDTVVEIFRGESKNPLFVSAIGIDKEEAAHSIQNMYGAYRLPHLLKLMDQITKEE